MKSILPYQKHESSHVYPGAKIGKGSIISEGAVIHFNVTIGENVYVGPYVILGEPAEHLGHHNSEKGYEPKGKVAIGNNVRLSEFVNIQSPTEKETIVGDDCYIMAKVHIGHDSQIGRGVTIAPGAIIGGFVSVGHSSTLGMNSTVHQRTKVPVGTMLGQSSVYLKNTQSKPWQVVVGIGEVKTWNFVGMRRHGIPENEIAEMVATNKILNVYPQ